MRGGKKDQRGGTTTRLCGWMPWLLACCSLYLNLNLIGLFTTDSSSSQSGVKHGHSQSHYSGSVSASSKRNDPLHLERRPPGVSHKCWSHRQSTLDHRSSDDNHPRVYLYDIPYYLRETLRKEWYNMYVKDTAGEFDHSTLNFGFGAPMLGEGTEEIIAQFQLGSLTSNNNNNNMNITSSKKKKRKEMKEQLSEYYFTHMHSMEIFFNERLKMDMLRFQPKWVTSNPETADIFIIPFPFALNYRAYHYNEWWMIQSQHQMLQDWLNTNPIYSRYFIEQRKMHVVTFGRIAYETGQMTRRLSPFWNDTAYTVISIDRNCHGDVRSCLTRVSMPHPSAFHPKSLNRLNQQIQQSKQSQRNVLLSFCGAVRTPTRKSAKEGCLSAKKKDRRKWVKILKDKMPDVNHPELCVFEDSEEVDRSLRVEKGVGSFGERRRRIEIIYAKQCIDLYSRSLFCIQEGADSTTRKGLWDGMIQGCIPVFLHGVMSEEFECYGSTNHPWYLVLHPDHYIDQLLSLSPEYVRKLQRNVLRMVPKLLYTDGQAGFPDAFDVILACLVRYSLLWNGHCTLNEMTRIRWSDTDTLLGYPQLYRDLGI